MKKLLIFGVFILFFVKCSKKEEPVADNTPTVVAKGTTVSVTALLTQRNIPNYKGIGCAPDGATIGAQYVNGTFLPYGKLETDQSIQKITSCTYTASTFAYTSNTTSKFAIAKGDTIFTFDTYFGTIDKDFKGKFTGQISISGGTGKFKGAIGTLKSSDGLIGTENSITTWTGDITTY